QCVSIYDHLIIILVTAALFVFIFDHSSLLLPIFFFFFFNHPATTEIYTLSLHDALPIYALAAGIVAGTAAPRANPTLRAAAAQRSEEHTSELQSLRHLVCRLLLEKKKKKTI